MSDAVAIMQCLTFTLASETYALEVENVREVLEMSAITPIPRAPDYLRGVINVRGSVVPVVDLRLKLGMPRTEKSIDTCIVVLGVSVDKETVTVGALVDSVQEVVDFNMPRGFSRLRESAPSSKRTSSRESARERINSS